MPDAASKSAQASAATRDWPAYFDAVAGKGPRETLLEALERFEKEARVDDGATGQRPAPPESPRATGQRPAAPESPRATGHRPAPPESPRATGRRPAPLAIDLGCGEGRDTVALLERGWGVLAIDSSEEGLRRLRSRRGVSEAERAGRLETVLATFDGAELPAARLVNASFCLPFCPPEHFDGLWRRIDRAIEAGGRFAGQFFGERDTWAALPDRTHLPRRRVVELFEGYVVEYFSEEDRPGEDGSGFRKHWHVFHIVARKRAGESPSSSAEAR